MNPARIAIIVVAGVAAVVFALLLRNIISRPRAPTVIERVDSTPAQPMVRVLTAKQDLGVGQRLTADNMAWQPWPATTANSAYVTDGMAVPNPQGAAAAVKVASKSVTDMATGGGPKMQSMVGAIVKEAIYSGEPITAKKIVRGGDSGYMAVRLPQGMVAMSLNLTPESDTAGFIQPGDHVDVMSSHTDTSKDGQGRMVTDTVLANAKVLAVDQHTDAPKSGETQPASTVTLEVPAGVAQTLARARTQGGLMLALRSYADIGGGAGTGSPGAGNVVRIFKGGDASEVVTAQ